MVLSLLFPPAAFLVQSNHPPPLPRSRLCGHKVGVAQPGQTGGEGAGDAVQAVGGGTVSRVPGAAVSGWRRNAGRQPPESLRLRGAGASTPLPAAGAQGGIPWARGPSGFPNSLCAFPRGPRGATHSLPCHYLLFLHLPRGRFALDQRLLSHPRMDSGALAFGEVPRASSELGRQ